jgi:hypothetical protein
MLKNIDLSREVAKEEYKKRKGDADLKLADLQRQAKILGIPVIVVFEGSPSIAPVGRRWRRRSIRYCGGSGSGLRLVGGSPSSTGAGIAGS